VSGTGTTAHGSWFQNRAWRDIPSPPLHNAPSSLASAGLFLHPKFRALGPPSGLPSVGYRDDGAWESGQSEGGDLGLIGRNSRRPNREAITIIV
jgi:hypothetical protein